jgi:hypothetical protein
MTKPTIAEVRDYVKVPTTALSDADLTRIYNAATDDQTNRCRISEPFPDALAQAFMRRIQREIAARNLPLGVIGADAAEYAPTRVPMFDALIEAHELPYRLVVLA